MRSIEHLSQRGALRATAACFLALVASCHSHDDGNNIANSGPPAGSSGDFLFSGDNGSLQRGEFFDCVARLNNGNLANIDTWSIVAAPASSGASLTSLGAADSVRFVAGIPGFYAIQAVDVNNLVGTYGFSVENDLASLMVVDVIPGTDSSPVAASLATSGNADLFIAERIGGPSAPQVIARANRAGDRVAFVGDLPYKIQDMAADDLGNVTVIRTESSLTAALVRLDRDLNEVATFSAPDLGTTAWRDIVAMTRSGETLVPVDLEGGSLLRLDAVGAPAGGTPEQSLIALGVPFADVIDVATDIDGAAYVATDTRIVRVGTDGAVDSLYWQPQDQTAIRGIATDEDGVVYVALQDADGGQCGSVRKLDWRGTQFRRIIEFSDGSEFAARKILSPVALGVFPDGAWRLYDDIVTLNPSFQKAAWILASEPLITE
ncbi:hypothetical protein Poly30_16310 [Planctomycetes bacterium Poly30]|uniref:Uncharacterized protein n=1 Tax=Saltatorellus ferox TaxID=2528018 RepID=A0A518EPW9_9BACT|nr:hypothetical protein Poly30_16310 [Planctomycetes bacterium Poly30]